MSLRTLTAMVPLSDGSPFTGMLRVVPLEEIYVDGMNVAVKPVDYAVTAGALPAEAKIVAPGRYGFSLLDGTSELQCFQAYVPEGTTAISLFDLKVSTYAGPPSGTSIVVLAQGSSVLLLAPGGGTDGEILTRQGGVLAWGSTPALAWSAITGKPATFPPDPHAHADATESTSGFMPAADKVKLDGIEPNATKNAPDAWLLDRANHTGLQLIETIDGVGDAAIMNIGTTAGTVAAGDHTHPVATAMTAGLMSPTDKVKLNSIPSGGAVLAAPIPYIFSARTIGFNIASSHTSAAPLEFNNASGIGEGRMMIDLTNATSLRLNLSVVSTVQPASCVVTAQFSSDAGATWNYFQATALNAAIDTAGQKVTGWAAIPPAAAKDVLVRIVGYGGGSGAASTVSTVKLDVR